jgi:hypothetical protein
VQIKAAKVQAEDERERKKSGLVSMPAMLQPTRWLQCLHGHLFVRKLGILRSAIASILMRST